MNEPTAAVRSLLVRHALGFAINFSGTLVLARELGPAVWGTYSVAYVALLILQGIVERGTVGHLIRSRDATFGTALTAQAVAGTGLATALVATTAAASARIGTGELTPLLHAVAIAVVAYALRAVPLGLLERGSRFTRVAAVEVADLLAFNAIAVGALLTGAGSAGLAAGIVARALVSLLLAWRLAGVRPRLGFSLRELREQFAFSAPYTAANALAWANVAAAPLLVGGIAGVRELGILQLAYSLVLYPQLLNTIVARVSFPLYASPERRPASVAADVERVTTLSIRFMGTGVIGVALTSPLWVPPLFGHEWLGVVPIMLTVAPAVGFATSLANVIAALNARGHAGVALAVGLAFTAVYWSGGYLLVPGAGALGLTLAQVIATVVFGAYLYLHARLIGTISLARVLATYAASCLLLIASALLIGHPAGTLVIVIGAMTLLWTTVRHLDRKRVASWLGALMIGFRG
ncbi:MAG: oligosaccharide flippase family protein [Candidatus Limnocylindria bacterium]